MARELQRTRARCCQDWWLMSPNQRQKNSPSTQCFVMMWPEIFLKLSCSVSRGRTRGRHRQISRPWSHSRRWQDSDHNAEASRPVSVYHWNKGKSRALLNGSVFWHNWLNTPEPRPYPADNAVCKSAGKTRNSSSTPGHIKPFLTYGGRQLPKMEI